MNPEEAIFPTKPAPKYIRPKPLSTTHREMFFHFHEPNGQTLKSGAVVAGTVFFRREQIAGENIWCATRARCVETDNFSRAKGRNAARRKYFLKPTERIVFGIGVEPTHNLARELYFNK